MGKNLRVGPEEVKNDRAVREIEPAQGQFSSEKLPDNGFISQICERPPAKDGHSPHLGLIVQRGKLFKCGPTPWALIPVVLTAAISPQSSCLKVSS